MKLTTHVLDTAAGVPGAGITIVLYAVDGTTRTHIASMTTNAEGRTDAPLASDLRAGHYELVFSVRPYFAAQGAATLYDEIAVRLRIEEGPRNYHVPLLIAPWGYSTYRGN